MTGDLLLADLTPDSDAEAASKKYVDDTAAAGVTFGNVTAQTSFGLSSSNGVATTASRSDHVHGTPAEPTAGIVQDWQPTRTTSGNIVTSSTGGAWALLTGSPEYAIDAAANDRIRIGWSGLINPGSGTFWDLVVVSSAPAIRRYVATDSSTAADEGNPALYFSTSFRTSGLMGFVTVQAGDLISGQIKFRWAILHGAASTIYLSSGYPGVVELWNMGPA